MILLQHFLHLLPKKTILSFKLIHHFDDIIFLILHFLLYPMFQNILNYLHKSSLTSFIQTHYLTDMILLIRSLCQSCNNEFEKFYNLLVVIIFCNFYQIYILCFYSLMDNILKIFLYFHYYLF